MRRWLASAACRLRTLPSGATGQEPGPARFRSRRCSRALMLIDVINDLEFAGGSTLLAAALPMAERLAALKRRAWAAGIPATTSTTTSAGGSRTWPGSSGTAWRWRARAAAGGAASACGRRLLRAEAEALRVLLDHARHAPQYLKTEVLVLTGLTADSCVLFTAADAHMRDFHVVVPEDCVGPSTVRTRSARWCTCGACWGSRWWHRLSSTSPR